MAFEPRKDHPLHWTDTELAFLIVQGLNATNLWRAWGYKSNRPSHTFMKRIESLGYVDRRTSKYKTTEGQG